MKKPRFCQLSALLAIAVTGFIGSCGSIRNEYRDEESVPPIPSPAVAAGSKATLPFQITTKGVGPIRLGMTVDEARRALPQATIERTEDGEGIAYVNLQLDGKPIMTLYAGEDDPGSPIDMSAVIIRINTFSPECVTSDGIGVGTLIADAEKVYGKTKRISVSEICSRQDIIFENHPERLLFRIDYSGDFSESGGSRTTTRYKPGAKIFAVAIDSKIKQWPPR